MVIDPNLILSDGELIEVTPPSARLKWVVTPTVHATLSMAAVAEIYNELVIAIRKAGDWEKVEYPCVEKMNGKKLWAFIEPDHIGLTFKLIYPSEY